MAPAGKGDRVMQRMFACLLVFVVLGLYAGLIVYDRDTLIRDTISDDLRPSFVFEPPTFDTHAGQQDRNSTGYSETSHRPTQRSSSRLLPIAVFVYSVHK
jgi:hypothetical protein